MSPSHNPPPTPHTGGEATRTAANLVQLLHDYGTIEAGRAVYRSDSLMVSTGPFQGRVSAEILLDSGAYADGMGDTPLQALAEAAADLIASGALRP